mmetsp:Transcript_23409/g.35514  ORF Transcript_23409/g.35514 Transcript_23409/m.35514 type:complete len:87 (+) Transcript_23409:1898-2158(+)
MKNTRLHEQILLKRDEFVWLYEPHAACLFVWVVGVLRQSGGHKSIGLGSLSDSGTVGRQWKGVFLQRHHFYARKSCGSRQKYFEDA